MAQRPVTIAGGSASFPGGCAVTGSSGLLLARTCGVDAGHWLCPNCRMSELSGSDELDALGLVPENLPELVARYGADVSDLAAVDELLSTLGDVPADLHAQVVAPEAPVGTVTSVAAFEPVPSAQAQPSSDAEVEEAFDDSRNPESGEISLGMPLSRKTVGSGEIAVDGEQPQSGSFQLADVEDDGAAEDPSAAMREAMSSQLPAPPVEPADAAVGAEVELSGFGIDEEGLPQVGGDDLDEDETEATLVVAADEFVKAKADADAYLAQKASAEAAVEEVASSGGADGTEAEDRADAEFDAMFDELTSPSSAPSQADDLCADGELEASGHVPPDVDADLARVSGGDFDDDEQADATEIFDAPQFVLGTQAKAAPPPPPGVPGFSESLSGDPDSIEELDLDELGDDLEILMDGDDAEDAVTVPPGKEPEKRPSFLGRLLGRKDKEEG